MSTSIDFFDELAELYQTDPEEFEKQRQELIDEMINDMCNDEQKERCRKIQWRLEQELRQYKNPTDRYNKMVEMFWESVVEFLKVLQGNLQEKNNTADIIPLNAEQSPPG